MGINIGNGEHGFKTVDGLFTSGMQKPDAGNSLKGYYIKFEFNKIDKDGNGTLSDLEILNRREEEINQLKQNLAFKEASLASLEEAGDTEAAQAMKTDIEELEQQIATEEAQSELYKTQMDEDKKAQQEKAENFEGWG